MPRISAACVNTRCAMGAADSSSSCIACSRATRPSCSAGKPATSTSSPTASAVLPAGSSATAPVASVRRKPSPAALTAPRIRTRCAEGDDPPFTSACTVSRRISGAVGAGRVIVISRVDDTSSRDAPGAAVGVVVGHEDAVHRDAGVEVLRRIGAADLADADGRDPGRRCAASAPGGRANPSMRCGRCRTSRRTDIGGGLRRRRPP